MGVELRVTVSGDGPVADAQRSLKVFSTLVDMLRKLEIGSHGAGRPPAGSRFGFTEANIGSLQLTLAPTTPRAGSSISEAEEILARAFDGYVETEDHEGVPPQWNAAAAAMALEIAKLSEIAGVRLELLQDRRTVRQVKVTGRTTRHLSAGLQVRTRSSIGSAIGRLDAVSFHDRFEAGLWLDRTDLRVGVRFGPEQLENVRAALTKRVQVSGRLVRDLDGKLCQIQLRQLEVLPSPEEAPPLTGLIGADPDLTGGAPTDEYLREIRGSA